MKRTANRFLSALLCLALLASLPAALRTEAKAAGLADALPKEAAAAFAGRLESDITAYGLCEAGQGNTELISGGLAYAALLNFDGDGVPELLVLRAEAHGGMLRDMIYEEVWQWNGRDAVQVFSMNDVLGRSPGTSFHTFGYTLVDADAYLLDEMYGSHDYGKENWFTLSRLREGTFVTAEQIEETWIGTYHEATRQFSAPFAYTLTITGSNSLSKEYAVTDQSTGDPAAKAFKARFVDPRVTLYGGWRFETNDVGALLKELSARAASTAAAAAPKVTAMGTAVQWTDATPFIDENGRTLVPLRAVADALGLTVQWNAAAREASFSDGAKTLTFPINSRAARASDGTTIQMDTAAVIFCDRTYAPVRCLAEYFGYSVGWDAATRTVVIR